MAKNKIRMPKHVVFSCNLKVTIGDINYGNHVSNDVYLKYAHETRLRFLYSIDLSEKHIDNNCGLIMSNALLNYKEQIFYPETLNINLAVENVHDYKFDFVYILKKQSNNMEAARIQTTMIAFNYLTNKITKFPTSFSSIFNN